MKLAADVLLAASGDRGDDHTSLRCSSSGIRTLVELLLRIH